MEDEINLEIIFIFWKKPKILNILFNGCNKLTSIDLSGFSFVNIIDISSMFSDCSALENLILPQNEMAINIQDFSYMFKGCLKLTEIDLSNTDFANVKKLSYMFYECKSLTSINFYTSVKATRIENIQGMFILCEKLINMDLSVDHSAELWILEEKLQKMH